MTEGMKEINTMTKQAVSRYLLFRLRQYDNSWKGNRGNIIKGELYVIKNKNK